jgi:phosphonatase-like hydrolase
MTIPQLVIFDLGGTTIRDRGEVPSAFAAALHEARIVIDPAEIQQWRGASKREVLRQLVAREGLPPAKAAVLCDRTYTTFSSLLRARLSATPDLAFVYAASTFAQLKAAGIMVALNSGFDREIVNVVLASVAWPADLIDTVVCADDVLDGRPAPDMIIESMKRTGVDDARLVAVVGDTKFDLEAALRAGVRWRIGVLSGAHDRATLETAPFTHVLDDVSEVPALWGDMPFQQ